MNRINTDAILYLDGDERFDSQKVVDFLTTDSEKTTDSTRCPDRTIFHQKDKIKIQAKCTNKAYGKNIIVGWVTPYGGQWNPGPGNVVVSCPPGCGSGKCVKQRESVPGGIKGSRKEYKIDAAPITEGLIRIRNNCCPSDVDVLVQADKTYSLIYSQKAGEARKQLQAIIDPLNNQPIKETWRISNSQAQSFAASRGGCASSAYTAMSTASNPWKRYPSGDTTCTSETTERTAELGPITAPAGSCGSTSAVGLQNLNNF